MLGESRIFGESRTQATSRMFGDSRIFGDSMRHGDFRLLGDARVPGNSRQQGGLWMQGMSRLYPEPDMRGDSRMYSESGESRMFVDSVMPGDSEILGKPGLSEYLRTLPDSRMQGDMRLYLDSGMQEDLLYPESRMHGQTRLKPVENVCDYNHRPVADAGPSSKESSGQSHLRMNYQDEIGQKRSGYPSQDGGQHKSGVSDLSCDSEIGFGPVRKGMDLLLNVSKGLDSSARPHDSSSHILTPSLTWTGGSQNMDESRALGIQGAPQREKSLKAFDYLRSWRLKMNMPTDSFMVERETPVISQQHSDKSVSSPHPYSQSDNYKPNADPSGRTSRPANIADWNYSGSTFAGGDTHEEKFEKRFGEPRSSSRAEPPLQSFHGRESGSQGQRRMNEPSWKWDSETTGNQGSAQKRNYDASLLGHEDDFSLVPGMLKAKRPKLSPSFAQVGKGDSSDNFRDAPTQYRGLPQSRTPVCDEQFVEYQTQASSNYFDSSNDIPRNWKRFSPFPGKYSPDSGRLTRSSFETIDPNRSSVQRSHSSEMRGPLQGGRSPLICSQRNRGRSPELPMRGRSPGPIVRGRSPGLLTRGRVPGPSGRGRSSPPARGRSPVSPGRGRSPGLTGRGRSPGPPPRGRSPGPSPGGRSGSPLRRGRALGPSARGRSPGPSTRERSPGPPMRGRSPDQQIRGRSPGSATRGRSPGQPGRGRSPGPPVRGRSPGPSLRGRSPGPSARGRSPGPSTRGRSPGPLARGRFPSPSARGRSPARPARARSPAQAVRGRSPGPSSRGRSPGMSREKSPVLRARGRSGPSSRGKSPGLSTRGRSPGVPARGRSPSSSARGRSPCSSARGKSPRSLARGGSPGTAFRGRSPGLSSRGRSPGLSSRGRSNGPSTRSPRPLARGKSPASYTGGRSSGLGARGRSPRSAREKSPQFESDKHFGMGRIDRSPLFEEVSLSPRSTKFWSPRPKAYQGLSSPQMGSGRSLSPDTLHRGCSPVSTQSILHCSEDQNSFSHVSHQTGSQRASSDFRRESQVQQHSVHLHQRCSPVSPEGYSRLEVHHEPVKERHSKSRDVGRLYSSSSDVSRGCRSLERGDRTRRIQEESRKGSERWESEDVLNSKKQDELKTGPNRRSVDKMYYPKDGWTGSKGKDTFIPQNGNRKSTDIMEHYDNTKHLGIDRSVANAARNIDIEGTPVREKSKQEEDDEDLRVQLLRLREQKVEEKIKQLEEESIETEFRLWKLEKNKTVLSDETKLRQEKELWDKKDHHPRGKNNLPLPLKRGRSPSPGRHRGRSPRKQTNRKLGRY